MWKVNLSSLLSERSTWDCVSFVTSVLQISESIITSQRINQSTHYDITTLSLLAEDCVRLSFYFSSHQTHCIVNDQNGYNVVLQFIIMVNVGRCLKTRCSGLFLVVGWKMMFYQGFIYIVIR